MFKRLFRRGDRGGVKRARKVLGALTIAMAVLLVGTGAYLGWLERGSPAPKEINLVPRDGDKKIGADESSVVEELPTNQAGLPTKKPSDPRWAMLLLGYGGAGHEGAYLTDSIMVGIVDPIQKSLTLVSIPRDSWVPQLFDGKTAVYNKLNTAYAFATDRSLYPNRLEKYKGAKGAGTFTAETVSRLLGVPVGNYLALDFEAFKQMINAVGGIDVDVPDGFVAQYPASDDPSIDPTWTTVRFDEGRQRMNGDRAIKYARAREMLVNASEGSDFARSRRQRLIMEAFKTKVMQPDGLLHIPQILAIAAQRVDTDYALSDAGRLGQLLRDWKDVTIYQTALTPDNYLQAGTGPAGTYVLAPKSAGRSWDQVRAFGRKLWRDPELGIEMAETNVVVVNGTGVAGEAGRLGGILGKLGYRIGEPDTGQLRTQSRLVDRTSGKAARLVEELAKELGIQYVRGEVTGSPQVTLELGTDYPTLSNLQVATDDGAPASAAGVRALGDWSPSAGSQGNQSTSGTGGLPAPKPTESRASRPPGTITPSAMITRTVLVTPSPPITPTIVRSVTPSPSRSPTPAKLSVTPIATATPSRTLMPAVAATVSASPTPSSTRTASATATATVFNTPTASSTPRPTQTRTPTVMATATALH